MRALMLEELELVSGGRAEDSGNGGVCGGSGCGGTGKGSGSSGGSNGGGSSGNSGGGNGKPTSWDQMNNWQRACSGLGVLSGESPFNTDRVCGTNLGGQNNDPQRSHGRNG